MKSKEPIILQLLFNNPTKEFHFEELLRLTKMARSKLSNWLNRMAKDSLLIKVKEAGKMPYYVANYMSPEYQNRKKIFAVERFYESGLLNHLSSLKNARSVIIFGSFSRWDWYKDSDIDIFIYGDARDFDIAKYEKKLRRNIQLFVCDSKRELRKMGSGLLKNIIKGDIIKGDIDFVRVKANA